MLIICKYLPTMAPATFDEIFIVQHLKFNCSRNSKHAYRRLLIAPKKCFFNYFQPKKSVTQLHKKFFFLRRIKVVSAASNQVIQSEEALKNANFMIRNVHTRHHYLAGMAHFDRWLFTHLFNPTITLQSVGNSTKSTFWHSTIFYVVEKYFFQLFIEQYSSP